MIPVGLRHPSLRYINSSFEISDFLNNILLYMPLGIALSNSSLLRTFLFGLSLSTAAEILQIGYVDRIPSVADIASNTCGALAGYLFAMIWVWATGHDPQSLRIPRWLAAAGIPAAIFGAVLLVDHPTQSDFSNWSSSFHLTIGNELTGDRPWDGTISAFQIYPFAMAPSQIDALARQALHENKLALPTGGLIPPTNSEPSHGLPFLSGADEQKFHDALVSQNQLSLLVFMQTSDLDQSGPARIITYSQDPGNRNFTLGQVHDTLTFRLRTPASGANGTNPALYSSPVLSLDHPAFVAAVYDGRISRLYLDGKLVAHADLGAKRPRLPRRVFAWLPREMPIREIELGASESLLSGLCALGVFALNGVPRRSSTRFLLGAAAGFALGAAFWIFGVSEPGLGLRILLECAGASLLIAASIENDDDGGHSEETAHELAQAR
jgi:hypothetical protein